ncbi:MAG: beta-galactosidase [Pseudomonadota bacterium]
MSEQKLGVCYYPEHWPEEEWAEQAAQMRKAGVSLVRIGEFAWSRIQPEESCFDWEWLDRAVATLAGAGLFIVMGTPTACPPHWLIDKHPDVLPVGADGRARGFGSRRHYSFSSDRYRQLAAGISEQLAIRYGQNPAVVGWQTDNEYGCHDTTLCYSNQALVAFRAWLECHYQDIDTLNRAWGNVFWSQEYRSFSDVGLPIAVTECNPAQHLAFRRFSSDQVVRFNDAMLAAIKPHGHESAWFTHNFMGNFVDFDHFDVMRSLDVASWDSYPLGFLDISWIDEADKARFRRSGHPDWASFHHSLYRAAGSGRFGVMEQQPGPVNWAANNAEPYPGMVRLWVWEALSEGAEFVSVFRWRQAPFAQEQMHAGMQHWDGAEAPAGREIRQVAEEMINVGAIHPTPAPVALVFDYPSIWGVETQPNQSAQNALKAAFEYYSAVRSLGVDIDIVKPGEPLGEREVVLLPAVPIVSDALRSALQDTQAHIVLGPRFDNRNLDHQQRHPMLPDDAKVRAIDGIRPGVQIAVKDAPSNWYVCDWLETLETGLPSQYQLDDGRALIHQDTKHTYINAGVSSAFLRHLMSEALKARGLDTRRLPDGLRYRHCDDLILAFNYGPDPVELPTSDLLFGSTLLPAGGVAAWR